MCGVLLCPEFVQKEVGLESWENQGPGPMEDKDICLPGLSQGLYLQAAVSATVRVFLAGLGHLHLGGLVFCFSFFSLAFFFSF